jgi:hypothetical protein
MDAATLVGFWLPITFVYPAERIVAAIILAVAVIAISEAVIQTGLELPTSPWEARQTRELTQEEIEQTQS